MNAILNGLYFEIYNEEFDYGDLSKRIKLQKAVYLLENMGVDIGDYSFSWNKYGPYSLMLDNDASKIVNEGERCDSFSEFAKKCFQKLKGYLNKQDEYDIRCWIECIASACYLKKVMRKNDAELLEYLEKNKPYLNNRKCNEDAILIAKEIVL